MDKKKIDKATAIKSILSDLKKGIDKPTILDKLGKRWTNSRSSIYNYYEAAEKLHKPYLDKIQEIENQTIEKVVSEYVTLNILSKIERQQILSDIVRGKKKVWKEAISKNGVEKLRSYDPLRYIAELNKMDGSYIQTDPETEEDFNGFDIQDV